MFILKKEYEYDVIVAIYTDILLKPDVRLTHQEIKKYALSR